MIEVQLEFAVGFLLASLDLRRDQAEFERLFDEPPARLRLLGPTFRHDVARAAQRRRLVGHVSVGANIRTEHG